jgi:hypothetical protein
MKYFKNNQITSNPIISNVINPSHETIISNGWYEYIDIVPEYNFETHYIEKGEVDIDGIIAIQQYVIKENIPIIE